MIINQQETEMIIVIGIIILSLMYTIYKRIVKKNRKNV